MRNSRENAGTAQDLAPVDFRTHGTSLISPIPQERTTRAGRLSAPDSQPAAGTGYRILRSRSTCILSRNSSRRMA